MAEAKKDRNRELYEAKEAGVPFTKLAEKYGITVTCANTIYRREKIKEEQLKELEQLPIVQMDYEIQQMTLEDALYDAHKFLQY